MRAFYESMDSGLNNFERLTEAIAQQTIQIAELEKNLNRSQQSLLRVSEASVIDIQALVVVLQQEVENGYRDSIHRAELQVNEK